MLQMEPVLREQQEEIEALAEAYEGRAPQEVLGLALDRWSPRIALSSSLQTGSMVLLDMASRMNRELKVFTIDTGRLPSETYEFIETIRSRYGIRIDIYMPETRSVQKLVAEEGPNLFYRSLDARMSCCEVRKVEPMRRALRDLDAWITGLRREQSGRRAQTATFEIDRLHGGRIKVNPLADWSENQIWDYIRSHKVPYHPLFDQGYTSIGCAPCTRAVQAGEDLRAGRWWWENGQPKECGIHFDAETAKLIRGRFGD